ncbi:Protein GLUTAMINE DUMPER [Parasponia andersonii]|uniref:Protein GLUTAMINE DUMPER n=1 Tax=Parasponia andersonii TaxID=3476 RepID=A0A2P5CAF0_PARAD|nr:Protein GLUTAMINE DUMPER [Parasponia andersonii]
MRPPINSTTSSGGHAAVDGGFRHWNSPIPYLFGGLALMLGLITVALLILACSYRKSSPSTNSAAVDVDANQDQKQTTQVDVVVEGHDQPKIVVIMAGDVVPTYLAEPACSTRQQADDKEVVSN